jgi:aspartate kinase
VALAASLGADLCQIYTDVDGVYTADPRTVKGARKLDEITFDEMLELASQGAQVLHNRSVEMAKRYNVNLEVISSFSGNPGTKVKEVVKTMEKTHVSGVAKDKNVARIALVGLADQPGIAFKVFSLLAKHNINVDIILQSIGRDESKDISFTVARSDAQEALRIIQENQEYIGFQRAENNEQVAKISIVGAGMANNAGVACKMFEALYNAGININMISTSEIKVSVLVDERDADRAVQAVHDRFFNEFGSNN